MAETYSTRHLAIDFDQWSHLATSDPEAFEAQRHQLIEEVIRRAPNHRQQRLRGLQWRLDRVRERSHTPLAACIRMSEMMWDTLMGDGGLRDTLETLSEPDKVRHTRPRARVFSLEAARRGLS